jgi:type I restriction enzyme, S subunit
LIKTFSLNLPQNWIVAKLEDLVIKIVGGGTPSKQNSAYYQGNIPWMSVKDMTTRRPQAMSDHITLEAVANSATKLIPPDTIIIATRMSLGKVVRVPFEVAINQDLKALFLPKDIEKDFIEYWFLAEASHIQSLGTGTTVKGIRLEVLQQLEVPLPPLNEQRRIVAKIDALKARSQRVKEELEAIPALLDQFRQSVLAAAFCGDLTADWREKNPDVEPISERVQFIIEENSKKSNREKIRAERIQQEEWFFTLKDEIPENWLELNFMDVTWLITCGVAKKPNYVERGIPFLSAQNAKPFKANLNDIRYISEEDFKKFTVGGKPEKNDILYSRVGAKFGEAAKVPFDFDFAIYVSLTLIKPVHSLIESDFLVAFLNSVHGLIQAQGGIWGSGIQNLNVENVRRYRIPLPPVSEQQEIISRVDALFKIADDIEQQYQEAKAYLDQLNQSILAKAFRGELVPQDPNDEPASVLLERIRAEREKLDTKKKAKGRTEKKSRKAKPEAAEPEQLSLPGFE